MADASMTYRTLGATGERVSSFGLGGFHIGLPGVSEKQGIEIVRSAVDRGINFMDNSWDYNEGASETRMGKALRDGYRDKVFLMTKIDGRTKKEAAKQIDESLKRLDVDCIDLVQYHEVLRFEDPHRIFDEEGAVHAFDEAKQAGKLRYVGFTGHKDPMIHLHTLEVADQNGYHFDTVQMPINVMDHHYRSFSKLVVPELVKRNIGVLGMKALGNGIILKSGVVTAIECLHYALSQPTSVVITGFDSMAILDQAFEALRTFDPADTARIDAILAKTANDGARGKYEKFKTSSIFDATSTYFEKFLGKEPQRLQDLMPVV